MFSHFFDQLLIFENFDQKSQQNHFLAKISVFGPKMPQFSKIKNKHESEKTFPRYMYLDGFGKFLVIFVQKYIFYSC